ncbi:MAG: hypothetical protein M0R80_08665 [Proteobacteria bacterium]|jgi:hypothetical protein|nr:hypothetical protein [Pseudomonadota bacterium]
MALAFPSYSKIKNRYCVAYYGPCREYVLQLLYLRSAIEKELPGLELYISCSDDCRCFIPDNTKIIFASEIGDRKKEVAYLRELRCDLETHPVWQWIQESKLTLKFLEPPQTKNITKKICAICTKANLPTKSMPDVDKLIKWVISKGFSVSENVSEADWVVGTENEQLFVAAIQGVKTTLVPTGLGTELYKRLFPSGEIF